jgi:hypothetical protein
MSTSTELLKRKAEIASMSLHAVVKGKDADGGNWKEIADIASVSATGGGMYIKRECRVGTLISIMLPMEPHLRCYDHDKELYRVWGLVQHCQPLSGDGGIGFHVGVAFIGKDAPQSYSENPDQGYKICGMKEDGLWKITEAKSQFKVRQHVRFWTNVDPYLALVDGNRDALRGERTFTENISKSGAAVFSTLDVNVGDRIKFICEKFDFSGLAVVCNRQAGKDGRERLHLQFVENKFPVERLETANEQKLSVV